MLLARAAVQADALIETMTAEHYVQTEPLKQAGQGMDSLTVVQDAAGRRLTKSFRRRGGQIVKSSYPNASEFRAFGVQVDGIASLATVLDELATDG
jgi:hypothetical protein